MHIKVKDVMSAPVIVAMMDEDIMEVKMLMKEKGIHAVPIVSYTNDKLKVEQTIKGIITSTDMCKEVDDIQKIEDVISSSIVHVVHVDATIKSAAKMMLKHKVHHLVAMDDGEIKGMLSSQDFVKLVAEYSLEENTLAKTKSS
jgi:predicted transcriptional regulator